ncbi:sensor domain-containing diguanylate cyclase [Sulfurimonas autotrophica]|uniref:Diguanylate cyclase/phosphodiesterase n=1 Tax=Sulfurimonas autotrophica (strain ATCC BAA-671 / DSM 16294 / JCM 11897 / OK10) TaxID=563040 RepID=E0UTV4_SULAO|nr:EAL domain-containing protein [Sulfurimonas autotrophica]ADN09398.1 diguanylate cyclase/phosphodiesterase [Sulfurimonas autotrophica DSM 16294]
MGQKLVCENLNEAQLSQLNITPKEYENILNIQSAILQKLALYHNYDDILQHLCLLTEQLLPNSVASIMLVNKKTGLMSVLSAPSIPESGWKALENLKPGPGGGSCGNAVFRNKPQYVLNTFKDERWVDLRKVAFDFNLCSCWSMPIVDENNKAIGSFALSSFEHRLPAPFHKKLLETAASIVNIVLKNKEIENKLQRMLYYDSLTGLHNKTYLDEILSKNKEQILLLLDINNFSYINNTYGFEIGDKLLIQVANILNKELKYQKICKLEADQFAIVLGPDTDIKKDVEKIKEYFYAHELLIDSIALNISFTYGAATGNENLFKHAIISLKHAKGRGRSSLYIFNNEEEDICFAKRKQFIEANNILYNALASDKIIPFFQGIRDNRSGTITKVEALARIKKDEEILSPYLFLEPAHSSGLIPEITKIMIDKTFKIMADNDYTFSINITEDDLIRHYILEYLNKKSAQYNILLARVTLEILEGISASGKKNHIKQLSSLKEKGYSIAIDDFGVEYSNFERILNLDIDFLKIDAKYIKDIDTNPKSYEITKAIVFFAKNANIPCVAEFVHNESVQKVVEDLGIEYSQGYYFSEPSPLPLSS